MTMNEPEPRFQIKVMVLFDIGYFSNGAR